jgi:hypothetical protein
MSESYVTTDGQSASPSWNKAPIWGLRPDFYYCQTVTGLLMWGAVSDKRTGLSFTIAAASRQRSHFRVRIPWDSWPYFTISDSRLPFSSPPTTLRVTVEVFNPRLRMTSKELTNEIGANGRENTTSNSSSVIICFVRCYETCVNLGTTLWFLPVYSLLRNALLASRRLAMDCSVTLGREANVAHIHVSVRKQMSVIKTRYTLITPKTFPFTWSSIHHSQSSCIRTHRTQFGGTIVYSCKHF